MSIPDLNSADTERVRAALPGYVIDGQVGRGGCGVVLSGTHRGLHRPVAIKQIPPQFAHDMQVRRRFVDEARLMAAIDHPHVVPVYDYIEHEDLCLLVMEYLPGGTVESRFATEGFDATAAVAVALSCAAGLEAAHRHGILHRDVKPSNLMFSGAGTLKLTDFGIAKIVGGEDTLVTRAGEIIGTPSYIAPEQVRGQQLSPATDVYALATMLYQLLSGVLPFPPGEDHLAMLFAHAYGEPVPLRQVAPGVPEPIADVVMRGLVSDPTERFDTAETFGIALAEPAAHCWGTDWLPPVGIPVIGADTIVAAATGSRTPTPGYPGYRADPFTGGRATPRPGSGSYPGPGSGPTPRPGFGAGPTPQSGFDSGATPQPRSSASRHTGTGPNAQAGGGSTTGSGPAGYGARDASGEPVDPYAITVRPGHPTPRGATPRPADQFGVGGPGRTADPRRGAGQTRSAASNERIVRPGSASEAGGRQGSSPTRRPGEAGPQQSRGGQMPPVSGAPETVVNPRLARSGPPSAPETIVRPVLPSRPEPPVSRAGSGPAYQRPGSAGASRIPPSRRAVPTMRVRPQQSVEHQGVRLVDVDRGDLVPIQQVVKLPSPRVPLLAAGILAVAAGAAAVLGLGAVSGNTVPPNTIRIAGVDPSSVDRIELDLSQPIPIAVAGTDAETAKLSWNVLGTRIGGAATPLQPGAELTASVPAPVNQYVLAGDLTADLTLSRNGTDTATYSFGVQTTQRSLTTVTAVATLLLALFSGAYAESNARALRRGNARFAATVGLTISTALFAVAGVGASWVLLGTEPTTTTLIVCATLGAATGFVAAIAGRRMGRRYRYLRLSRIRDLL